MIKVKEDLVGRRFGRLKVIARAEDHVRPNGHRDVKWICECSCEEHNIVTVLDSSLKRKNRTPTKSCGCLAKELIKERSKKFNRYAIVEDVVYIYFNNSDNYTMVNLDKWNSISYIRDFCWVEQGGYARARIPNDFRSLFNTKTIGLHQLICPCEDGYESDHLDRNPLNNLTNNLVPKTRLSNMLNKGMQKNNRSGIKGVYWDNDARKWAAQISINKKRVKLGRFDDIKDATIARLMAEAQYWKDNAPQKHLFAKYGIEVDKDVESKE